MEGLPTAFCPKILITVAVISIRLAYPILRSSSSKNRFSVIVGNRVTDVALGVLAPLLIVVAGFGLVQLTKQPQPEKMPALGNDEASLLTMMPAAQVLPVLSLTDTLDIVASGVVVPSREINLAAEVAGRVVHKDPQVRAGNKLKQGQVLLTIDRRDFEFESERSAQKLEQEKVNLLENQQEIENTKRLLEVAEDQVELAVSDRKRLADLDRKFASTAELDASQRALLTAQNQVVTLQNQLEMLSTRSQKIDVAIKMATLELNQSKLNLQRTEIKSPVDGIVVSEQIEADSFVQRGANLMTIEDTSRMEVACSLRMDQLYWILNQGSASSDSQVNAAIATLQQLPKIQATIGFRLGGRESIVYEWDGQLDRFDGKGLDPQSRMIPVRIVVDNPNQYRVNGGASNDGSMTMVRGMFVEVVLKAKPATQLLLVPKKAVKPATDSHRVWLFEPGPKAYELVQQRRRAKAESMQQPNAESLAGTEQSQLTSTDAGSAGTKIERVADRKLNPDQWQPGVLKVLEGLEVVSSAAESQNDASEYLVCDSFKSGLKPGDLVVVTPLPGVESGEEPIRVAKDASAQQ
jgi:multidrug efflux pump subunit AcrA (membrane-fusion protein)